MSGWLLHMNNMKKDRMIVISAFVLIARIFIRVSKCRCARFNPEKPARYSIRFNGDITIHKSSIVIKPLDLPLLDAL